MTLHFGSRRPLPHFAYLEALADCEENTPRWHALTAGYAALQLFDLWVEQERGTVPPSDLEKIKTAVEKEGETAFEIGEIIAGEGPSRVEFV